nr:hypothetical protein [Akkermansiaceae bacterium]
MIRCLLLWLVFSVALEAAPPVVVERGKLGDGGWSFPSIVSPRRGDLAEQAELRLSGTLDDRSGPLVEFANGAIASRGDDPGQVVFLSHRDHQPAILVMDLGGVRPVSRINSYSFHHYPPDGGARGPQV